jgi:hypothetical protein
MSRATLEAFGVEELRVWAQRNGLEHLIVGIPDTMKRIPTPMARNIAERAGHTTPAGLGNLSWLRQSVGGATGVLNRDGAELSVVREGMPFALRQELRAALGDGLWLYREGWPGDEVPELVEEVVKACDALRRAKQVAVRRVLRAHRPTGALVAG